MKIAGVQLDIVLGKNDDNVRRIGERFRAAVGQGAKLVVFPECAVSGYCFDDLAEALPFAETIPGPATTRLAEVCRELDAYLVTGMLERDASSPTPRVFNTAVLLGPGGVIGRYRKIHLPFLGVDRFTTHGDDPPRVWPAGDVRLGMNICYDGGFPEASRVMALDGAELIVLPTNWPPAAECFARHTIHTRAMENHVYYMSVNRVGTERGYSFIGLSMICDPTGKLLAAAGADEETMLVAEIDPAWARNKHLVRQPRLHEIHRFRDRRPELYGRVIDPTGFSSLRGE